MTISYYSDDRDTRLAYVRLEATAEGDSLPAVMFLGGFKSDMAGTKAVFLEEQCRARGQEFVRFDYSGHGESDGAFADGTIGSWAQDALDVLDNIVKRDVVLVGSSMGGWISLLLLKERPERIKGVVGIAAAPDFTKDIEEKMTDSDWDMVHKIGRLEVPNDYSVEPYIFTKDLLDDGKENSLLDKTHNIEAPLILLQGKLDDDVEWEKANRIVKSFPGPETQAIFIDDGDHRLSRDQDLKLIDQQVCRISAAL